ncbi:MAG: cupredoxin domain-containing protein [Gemmatimonadales bacterium]
MAGLCTGAIGPGHAAAATLSGILVLQERGQPATDLAGAMVYFTPEAGVGSPPRPVAAELVMRDRRFSPRTIAVPVGSTVRFGNADPIRHNVFSVSPGNRFDLGLYGEGPGRAQRFERPGLARIFCNVHRTMSAFVLVLETPFHAAPDAAGRFTLDGLPEGPGTLHVWHPRAEAWSRALHLPLSDPVMVTLEATLPLVPPHLDKHGQPYREPADDERYR